jgi:LacI family transcriptional regulator
MAKIRIGDLAAETGLSRATVDRALNGREGVHPRTKALVEAALVRLGAQPVPASAQRVDVDMVLRLGRGLMSQLQVLGLYREAEGLRINDTWQKTEAEELALVRSLCKDTSRPLVITAKNSEPLTTELARARAKGKRVIAFLSDLSQEARDQYVGIDNRASGRAAALLIGRFIGNRPSGVGVLLGSSAFRAHEDREIGFRATLRSEFPKIALMGEAMGDDDPGKTQRAVTSLLDANPALIALYNVGGGNLGLARALRAAGRANDIWVVGHEVNKITAPLLRDGVLDFALATHPQDLFEAALSAALEPKQPSQPLGFAIYMRYNLPPWPGIAE